MIRQSHPALAVLALALAATPGAAEPMNPMPHADASASAHHGAGHMGHDAAGHGDRAAAPPAADAHAGHTAPPTQQFVAEELHPADVMVTDQDGRRRAFVRDVLPSGPVAITFIYTSCTTICPVANAIFHAVDSELDAADDDARLISISIDPDRDGPAELKAAATAFGAGRRWTFVTGSRQETGRLLRSFGLQLGAVEDHDPMFLVGNGTDHRFVRIIGFPDPATVVDLLRAETHAAE